MISHSAQVHLKYDTESFPPEEFYEGMYREESVIK